MTHHPTPRFRHGPLDLGPLLLVIECNSRELLDRFAALLAGFPPVDSTEDSGATVLRVEVSEFGTEPAFRAFLDDMPVCAADSQPALEERVTRVLNRRHLDEQPEHLHLHAGAVCRDDDMVLIVGPSGAGKSTLVARLVSLGWSYLSDEQIGVLASGALVAYPRSLSLRRNSWRFFPQVVTVPDPIATAEDIERVEVSPRDLGPIYDGGPAAPTLIVCPDSTAPALAHRRTTKAEALSLLVADTLDLERAGDQGITALLQLVESAPCYHLAGQDLDAKCDAIAELCDQIAVDDAAMGEAARVDGCGAAMSWQFSDGSAAIYEPQRGALGVVDRLGLDVWTHLANGGAPIAGTAAFAAELAAAGLLDG